jgi:hypothetical protein
VLDEAIRLAEQVVKLRKQAGQPAGWHECVGARQCVVTLTHLRALSVADRRQSAADNARDPEEGWLYASGQCDQALAIARSQLAIRWRLFPGDQPGVAASLINLARSLGARGALAEAEPLRATGSAVDSAIVLILRSQASAMVAGHLSSRPAPTASAAQSRPPPPHTDQRHKVEV